MKRLLILQALALTIATATAEPARAQAEEQLQPGLFSEMVDVRVVNVEVVVTDRDGVLVRGLGVEDFVLEIDGAEVAINYFSEVRGGTAIAAESSGGTALPAVPALVPGEPAGTSFLVFIDDFFTFKEDRNRALEGISQDLALLGPDDRMAVVAFDGRELEMLSSWSQSGEALERAFAEARRRPTQGVMRLNELRQYERNTDRRPAGLQSAFELDPETKSYVLRLGDQVDRMLRGAAATLRSFAKPPGRKVMLMLTGGWPYSPTEFVVTDFRGGSEAEVVEREHLFRQLSDTANLLGYTLYPADVSGQGSRWIEDPASASRAQAGSSQLYLARTTGRQYSSRYLARETGGTPLLFENAHRAFSKAVADTRSYYWLGFSPDRAWDDAVHDVVVRTRGGELKVRSRQGFLDVSRVAEVTMSVESAFLFGSVPESSELKVEFGASRKAGFRKMEVAMTLSLPYDAMTFVPYGDGLAAALEIRLAVEDAGSRMADIPTLPVRLEVTTTPPAGERWEYTVPLKMRRQEHRAMVAVYDATSGKMYTSGVVIKP